MLLRSGLGYNNLRVECGKALGVAAENGNERVVQALLGHGPEVINCVDREDGRDSTALHKAAANGHEEVVQILLSWDVDIQPKDFWNETALHKALKKDHLKIVKLLLKSGARVGQSSRRSIHERGVGADKGLSVKGLCPIFSTG